MKSASTTAATPSAASSPKPSRRGTLGRTLMVLSAAPASRVASGWTSSRKPASGWPVPARRASWSFEVNGLPDEIDPALFPAIAAGEIDILFANEGELATLTAIVRPQFGCVVSIGPEHLEGFIDPNAGGEDSDGTPGHIYQVGFNGQNKKDAILAAAEVIYRATEVAC
mgnify:CR=1 FL=1